MIAALASLTYGVVTREGLLGAGITPGEIKQRLRTGSLIREYRSVYRVGHRAWSVESAYSAAVAACGRGAWLCGHAAVHLYALDRRPTPQPEVLALTKRRVPGVITHRAPHRSP